MTNFHEKTCYFYEHPDEFGPDSTCTCSMATSTFELTTIDLDKKYYGFYIPGYAKPAKLTMWSRAKETIKGKLMVWLDEW